MDLSIALLVHAVHSLAKSFEPSKNGLQPVFNILYRSFLDTPAELGIQLYSVLVCFDYSKEMNSSLFKLKVLYLNIMFLSLAYHSMGMNRTFFGCCCCLHYC